jgi:hypothetical protein
VYIKDIAAQYLKPFEDGGAHFLGGKRGLLVPINAATNQYGNLSRGTLAKLKGRPDVFVGAVKTKSGESINGVWQRVATKSVISARVSGRGGKQVRLRKLNDTEHLKLLIRFSDPKSVRQHLGWGRTAQATVRSFWRRDFDAAMRKAMASKK